MINFRYFGWFILILLIELYIGFYVHDAIIRPYIGDLLVVVLIYAFIRIFVKGNAVKWAVFTFVFACAVEFAQYLKIVEILGLQHNKVARILIGTSFSWVDILAYLGGFVIIVFAELFFAPPFKALAFFTTGCRRH